MSKRIFLIFVIGACIALVGGRHASAQQTTVTGQYAKIDISQKPISANRSDRIHFVIKPSAGFNGLTFVLPVPKSVIAIESIRKQNKSLWITNDANLFQKRLAKTVLIVTGEGSTTLEFAQCLTSSDNLEIDCFLTLGKSGPPVKSDSSNTPNFLSIKISQNQSVYETLPIPLKLEAPLK